MDYSNIKEHFRIKEDHGDKCKAICPVHPDKEASLSISYDRKERKTIIYCHAGCEVADIVSAVGLRLSDLFDEPLQTKDADSRIEKIYQYRDSDGNVLFEKVRFKPTDEKKKGFTQRREIENSIVWGLEEGTYYETYPGSNEWTKNLGKKVNPKEKEFLECEPVIYNLNIILKAIAEGKEICIAEGEKDADNLTALGFPCTCNFDGASVSAYRPKWRTTYNDIFKGAKVIIFNDNDDPGRAHADNIAKELYGIAEYIKRPEIPNLLEKEDISDFIAAGHTKEEILDLVEHTEIWNPSLQPETVDLIGYNFSDVGNAERLIATYGKIIRYRPGKKNGWLIWSGKHWQVDYNGKIEVLSRKVIKILQQQGREIPNTDENEKFKKEIQRFVLKSEADNRIKAMINQAKSQMSIVIKEIDKNVYLLNLKNGTLNLKTGELKDHNRRDYITRIVNIEYNSDAKCPRWIEFINKIFLERTELIEYIQKSIGYSLTGDSNLQCFYILHGQGSNGKGTFMKAIMTILGDYAAILKGNSLMEKMGDEGARGDLAKLEGKYFVCVNELEEGKSFDEALVKSLSSGADEAIPVRRMYEEEFDLHPTFKMWMTTNKLPKIKGTDNGIWRRVRKIPFEYNFENDENKDEHFFDNILLPEISGILNWAIEGCVKWQQEGMNVPDIVKYANEDYKNDMDAVQRFIDECCVVSETCRVKRSDLYDAYCIWCKENKEYTLSSRKINKKIAEKNFQEAKIMGIYYWKGVGLASNDYNDTLIPCEDNVTPFWNEK